VSAEVGEIAEIRAAWNGPAPTFLAYTQSQAYSHGSDLKEFGVTVSVLLAGDVFPLFVNVFICW